MKKLILALLIFTQVNTANAVVVGFASAPATLPLYMIFLGGAAVSGSIFGITYPDNLSVEAIQVGIFVGAIGYEVMVVGAIALDADQKTYVFSPLDSSSLSTLGLEPSEVHLYNSYVPEYNLVYEQIKHEVEEQHLTEVTLEDAKAAFTRAADTVALNSQARSIFSKVMQKTLEKGQ